MTGEQPEIRIPKFNIVEHPVDPAAVEAVKRIVEDDAWPGTPWIENAQRIITDCYQKNGYECIAMMAGKLNQLKNHIEELSARLTSEREVREKLVEYLTQAIKVLESPELKSMCTIGYIHGREYSGPSLDCDIACTALAAAGKLEKQGEQDCMQPS